MRKLLNNKLLLLFLLLVISNSVTFAGTYDFNDVKKEDWYYSQVMRLTNEGIISGYSDNTFRGSRNLTYGETLALFSKVLDIKPHATEPGEHWALGHYKSFKEFSLIGDIENLNSYITREAVFDLLLKSVYETPNTDIKYYFRDSFSLQGEKLYELGLINGVSKSDGIYLSPNSNLTRAEISALLVNILDYNKSRPELSSLSKVEKPTIIQNLNDMIRGFVYMAQSGNYSQEFKYGGTFKSQSDADLFLDKTIISAFHESFELYPEYLSYFSNLSANIEGTQGLRDWKLNVTLYSEDFTNLEIKSMLSMVEQEVFKIKNEAYSSGRLKLTNTESEKAEYYYNYIIKNNSYDMNFKTESYTSYGILKNKSAVCQGYTSFYNLLLKSEGIEVKGQTGVASGDLHIWSYAKLDGAWYYIDSTFGDPVPNKENYSDMYYFKITEENLRKTHTW